MICLERQLKAKEAVDFAPLPPFRYGTGILILKSKDINLSAAEEASVLIQAPEGVTIESELDNELVLSSIENTDMIKAWHVANSKIRTIRIPQVLSNPIIIKHNPQKPGATHLFIIAEPDSKALVIEEIYGKPEFYTNSTEILLKENSEITHVTIQALDKNTYYSNFQHAWAEKNSKIKWLRGNFGADYSRSENMTNLKGEKSDVKSWLIFTSKGSQQQDIAVGATHLASQTTSDMVSRGVVKDQSKNIYRGKIRASPKTKGIDGYQKHDVLILNDDAEADAIPELEIETDDVKCSHGVSIGKIDEEHLFYLMSRGLSELEAKREIIEGFFYPVIKDFNIDLKEEVKQRL